MTVNHPKSHFNAAIAIAATLTLSGSAAWARTGDGPHGNHALKAFRDSHPELTGAQARLMGSAGTGAMHSAPRAPEMMSQSQWLNKHWQAPSHQSSHHGLRTIQLVSDVAGNISRGVDLDLTSSDTSITLGSQLFKHGGVVTITTGGATLQLSAGSQVTPGEFVAVKQELDGGHQTVVLDAQGRATGGTIALDSITANNDPMKASSLVVSAGVNVIGNFGRASDFHLDGNLINNGSIYATSDKPSARAGSISAEDIVNNSGALISTSMPEQLQTHPEKAGRNSAPIDLTLNAQGDLLNSGVIESSGNLTLSAGGNIGNSRADGGQGRIIANADVNLIAPHVVNSGSVTSNTGNINISAPLGADLTVTNGGGVLSAVNGNINIGNINNQDKVATTVTGGDLYSQQVNLYSGDGALNFNAGEVTGRINAVAGTVQIDAVTKNLILGDILASGDPLIFNAGGDVTLSGTVGIPGTGEPVSVLASHNIFADPGTQIVTSGNGISGDLLLVAGATLSDTGPTVNVTPGNGGVIDIGQATVIINNGGGVAGNITIVAFSGAGGNGSVTAPNLITDAVFGNGGSVNIIAAGNITTGTITSGTDFGPATGSVSIMSATPFITGGPAVVVDKSTFTISSGAFAAGALSNGNITLQDVRTHGGNLTIKTGVTTAGLGITAHNIDTGGNTVGGDAVIQSGALININNIGTSSFSSSGGNVTVSSGSVLPSDFYVNSISADTSNGTNAGNVTVTGPIQTIGTSVAPGLGFVAADANNGGTGGTVTINMTAGDVTVLNTFPIRVAGGNGNSGNIILNHAGTIILQGGLSTSVTPGFNNGDITINTNAIVATGNLVLSAGGFGNGNPNTGNLNVNVPIVTANNGNVQFVAGNDLVVEDITSSSFIALYSGHDVTFGSLTSTGPQANNAVNIFAVGTVAGNNATCVPTVADNGGGQFVVQTQGLVSIGGLIDTSASATGSGSGGEVFIQAGQVVFGNINNNATNSGTGGTTTIQSKGSLATGAINANAGVNDGFGGDIELTYNSSSGYTVPTLSARAFGPITNGGTISVQNQGTGTILLSAVPTFGTAGIGSGGTLSIATGGTMAFGPAVTSISADGTGGGGITLKAGTFDLSALPTALSLIASGNPFSTGTVTVQATSPISTITVGNTAGTFDLNSNTGNSHITAGALVSINENLTAPNGLVLKATNGDVVINGIIQVSNQNAFAGTAILATGNVVFNNSVTSSSGLLVAAGGNITNGGSSFQLFSGSPSSGADMTLAAGASWTENAFSFTINGASATGGNIDLSVGVGVSSISSSAANGQPGNITLVAYDGGSNGGIYLPTSSNINSGPDTANNEPSGKVVLVAGRASGVGINIGTINPSAPGSGGTVDVATATPGTAVDISKFSFACPQSAFLGGTVQNAALQLQSVKTYGSHINLTGGASISVNTVDSAAPFYGGPGGDVTMVTGNSGFISTGAIDARSVGNLAGTVSITAGSGGVSAANILANEAAAGGGGGGSVTISTTGPLSFAASSTVNATAAFANFAGTINISANSLSSNTSLTLDSHGISGATDGAVIVTTTNISAPGDLTVGSGTGGFLLPVTGPNGTLTLSPGRQLTVQSDITTGTFNLNLFGSGTATQLASAHITAGALNTTSNSGDVLFNITANNAILNLDADATGGSIIRVNTSTPITLGSIFGSFESVFVTSTSDINTSSAVTALQLVLTAGGSINVNTGHTVNAGVTFNATNSILVNANIGTAGANSLLTATNGTISGTGTIKGLAVSLNSALNTGTNSSTRLSVDTGTLSSVSTSGSVFLNNVFASQYVINNSQANSGNFDITGSSSIKTNAGQSLSATNVLLTSTAGGLTLTGDISGFTSTSLTAFNSIVNGDLTGTLTTNKLDVKSLNGDIGASTSSRFTTNVVVFSANAPTGNVFLNLTSGSGAIFFNSSANGVFDTTSANTIDTAGTVTADRVVLNVTSGNIGTSTASRFNINANKLTAVAPSASINVNSLGSNPLQLEVLTPNAAVGTIDILSNNSLVPGTGMALTGNNLTLVSTNGNIGLNNTLAGRIAANSNNISLNAPSGNVFFHSTNGASMAFTAACSASAASGTFDVLADGGINSTINGNISAKQIVLTAGAAGSLSFNGSLTSTGSISLSAGTSIVNSNFIGAITTPVLNLTSTGGNVGSSTLSRFSSSVGTISANAASGNVFLDLTNSSVTIGSSSAGTTFDIVTAGDIAGGTITAPTVKVSAGGDVGVSTSNRLVINASSFSASSTGSVFIQDTNAGTSSIIGNSVVPGTFDVLASGVLQGSGDVTATDIVLAAPSGSLSLTGNLNGSNSISLTSSGDLNNSTFVGSIVTPSLSLTSTAGSIGTSTSSRFSSGAATVSASAPTGNVFLDLTHAGTAALGTSQAGTTFDVTTTADLTGGTVTAPTVIVTGGGNVGVSAGQRFVINAPNFKVSAPAGNVFLSNLHAGSTTLNGPVVATTTYDVVTSNDLVIAGNITASSTISVSSGGLLSATSGTLTANQVNLSSVGTLNGTTFNATVSAQTLDLQTTTGDIGSLANRFPVSTPVVEFDAGGSAFLSVDCTNGVKLQNSTAGTAINVASNNGQLTLGGAIGTGNGDMSIVANGLGSSLNVLPAANLTTTEGDVSLLVTDQTKLKTVPIKIFIGNGANIKGSGTTAGVGEVFIGTGTLPFPQVAKKPPKGVTITNQAPGQVFIGKKSIGIVKKATNISLKALQRNVVFNLGSKEKKTTITLDSNVTITGDPPGDAVPTTASRTAGQLRLLQTASTGFAQPRGATLSDLDSEFTSTSMSGFGNLNSPVSNFASGTDSTVRQGLVTANTNSVPQQSDLFAMAQIEEHGTTNDLAYGVDSIDADAEFVSDSLRLKNQKFVSIRKADASDTHQAALEKLSAGAKVYAPNRDITVDTPEGKVTIAGDSLVLVVAGPLGLAVYDLHDSKKGAVRIETVGKEITLSPGRHALVSSTVAPEYADLNPIEAITHRGLKKHSLAAGKSSFISEFSVLTAIDSVPSLTKLVNSKNGDAKKLSSNLLKTVAVLLSLGTSSEPYRQHCRPQLTASR